MKIELFHIPIKDLFAGYKDSDELGVTGFDGKLDIRPPFQRNFIYKEKQRNEVINTILKGFPLNIMYWTIKDSESFPKSFEELKNFSYELLDGQQRTVSICQFLNKEFSVDYKYWHNLPDDIKEQFLNYNLMVYVCSGTASEKLDWFKIINIAGAELSSQELRNAVYSGSWCTDAKKYFSKRECPAYVISKDYVKKAVDRQELLETAIYWIALSKNLTIEEYMGQHQHDENASELWQYFQLVINWAKMLFPKVRPQLKQVKWGELYLQYKDTQFNAVDLEKRVAELLKDSEIDNKAGIYPYLLSGDEHHLNLRAFTIDLKEIAYENQQGKCKKCGKHFELNEMEGDHITPWCEGGKTVLENLQMLCRECNRRKSNK